MKLSIMPHGWMGGVVMGRPRTRFFTFLSVLWGALAFIGCLLLWQGDATAHDAEIRRWAWLFILPEPLFIGLAVFFRLTERPRRISASADWEGPIVN